MLARKSIGWAMNCTVAPDGSSCEMNLRGWTWDMLSQPSLMVSTERRSSRTQTPLDPDMQAKVEAGKRRTLDFYS